MADEKWSGFDIEVSTTGTRVVVLYPDGESSTNYKNASITIDNFFSTMQSQITDNANNISTDADRITVLENGLTKTLDKAQNTSYQPTQSADSRIINFGFRVVSGSPTVAVGTGAGLGDIVTSRLITEDERSANVQEYSTAGRTLYITITGGSVDVAIFSRENLYEV